MPDFDLNPVDISIVIGYIVGVLILGFYIENKHEDSEGYFLAGRSLTGPLIGFSLFASNMSSNSLVGLTARAILKDRDFRCSVMNGWSLSYSFYLPSFSSPSISKTTSSQYPSFWNAKHPPLADILVDKNYNVSHRKSNQQNSQ